MKNYFGIYRLIGKYYQANYSYDTYNHSYYQQSIFDTLGQYRLLTISSNGTDHIHNGYIYCFHKYTIHNVKANLSKFILVIVFGSWAVKRTIENIPISIIKNTSYLSSGNPYQ